MTEEVKYHVNRLREMAKSPGRCLIAEPDLTAIADITEQLSAELKQARQNLAYAESAVKILKKERYAAITDLWNMCSCKKCKHVGSIGGECENCYLRTVPGHPELSHRTNWEWRGVCAENGGAEDA